MNVLPPELEATYEILEPLREGGMGAVYKARHRHLEETCVIKVMRAKLQDVGSARERFLGEARKGKQLRHPNIAEFIGLFVSPEGKACLVMEYISGANLRELLAARRGPLEPKLVVTIGVQALAALGFLHSRKIVHRDISPDNLMLTRDRDGGPLIKLIDLGIAKSLEETYALTETGMFVGKISYAPPEQFAQNVDARSDLYSLGVVLYELLTGTMPIVGPDTLALLAAIQNSPPRPFSETDPTHHVPEALRRIILKALEKKPEDRFQTADEFSTALQRSLASNTTTVAGVMPAATIPGQVVMPPPDEPGIAAVSPKSRPVWPFGLAAAALLGIGGVWVLGDSKNAATGGVPVSPAAVVPAPATPNAAQGKAASSDSVTRGRKFAADGDLRRAYDAFADATRSDPSNAYAWANLGGAAALLEKPAEARRACERALEIDPANWLAHYNLACQLARAGEREEGLRHIGSAVAELKRQARDRAELEVVLTSIRGDEALGELRNDPRFAGMLSID